MNFPEKLKYTKDHEWIRVEGQFCWIGITDYAQSELGDIVYVDIPAVGTKVEKGKSFERLAKADGIVVPGGFGERGIEGKILAARYARVRSASRASNSSRYNRFDTARNIWMRKIVSNSFL